MNDEKISLHWAMHFGSERHPKSTHGRACDHQSEITQRTSFRSSLQTPKKGAIDKLTIGDDLALIAAV